MGERGLDYVTNLGFLLVGGGSVLLSRTGGKREKLKEGLKGEGEDLRFL